MKEGFKWLQSEWIKLFKIKDKVMESKLEYIAKACYEANRVWCQANEEDSLTHWDNVDQDIRDHYIDLVNYRIGNLDQTSEEQHNAWMEIMINDGWKYGEIQDSKNKIDCMLIHYNDISEFQKKRNALFSSIVDTLK